MRMFKKIAAMIMAVAMLCSFTALGAGVTIDPIAEVTTDNPAVKVKYTSTDVKEVTVLAYAGEKLEGANLVYINQLAGNSDVDFALGEKDPFGKYTVMMGGTGLDKAATATFNYKDATSKYTITVADAAYGTVTWDAASLSDVKEGTPINFTFVPYLGYELKSLMVGETDVTASVDGNRYTLTVAANTTIAATFEPIKLEDTGKSVTYPTLFDVEKTVVDDNAPDHKRDKSKLAFGQAQEIADATITSMGMYVQVKNGDSWADFKTTGGQHYGPKFPAAKWTSHMKYGIRFFSFPVGTYKIWSYVDYSNGTSEKGAEIEFTVE